MTNLVKSLCLGLMVLLSTSASAKTFTSNFDGSEDPLSEGGVWTTGEAVGLLWTDPVKIGGVAFGTHADTGFDDSIGHLSGFGADQIIEGTVFTSGSFSSNQEIELLVRFEITANSATGYEILIEARNGYSKIVRWNGGLGQFTILGNINWGSVPINGDVLRVEAIGSTITIFKNGSQISQFTGLTTWPDGNPGIGFFSQDGTGSQNDQFGWTSFTAISVPEPNAMLSSIAALGTLFSILRIRHRKSARPTLTFGS